MKSSTATARKVVEVRNLVRHFPVRRGSFWGGKKTLKAVDGIDFDVFQGETFGIVGESGCGKSTTAKLVLNMIAPTSGSVKVGDLDVTTLRPAAWRRARLGMQMMFQDPLGALDPYMTIGRQIREPLDIHRIGSEGSRKEKALRLLDAVGMEEHLYDRYPHELSGGQRQRAVLARALILEPRLLVCDEPVSALDVSIQAQVVNLLKRMQSELDLTYIFISHDLRIVKHICSRVAVMYLGKIIEQAGSEELFRRPLHPYTRALMSSIPIPDPSLGRQRIILSGEPPNPIDLPRGCRFSARCPRVTDRCRESEPALEDVGDDHRVACYLAEREV